MKEKRLLSLLLTVMLSIVAFAQNQTFTGTVVDPNGEPVIGATIVQKGTSNTTATDFDGNFSITCPAGACWCRVGNHLCRLRQADRASR